MVFVYHRVHFCQRHFILQNTLISIVYVAIDGINLYNGSNYRITQGKCIACLF